MEIFNDEKNESDDYSKGQLLDTETKNADDLEAKKTPWIILLFLLLVLFVISIPCYYYMVSLRPSEDKIYYAVQKFSHLEYSIPNMVAERYLAYAAMRDFYYSLYYGLSIISVIASLFTITYATFFDSSNDISSIKINKKNKSALIFFSMIAMLFTIINMLANPLKIANTSQHAWAQLEQSINSVLYDDSIEQSRKNEIITNTIADIEEYIEARIYE